MVESRKKDAKVRETKYELLRLLAMLMIMASHSVKCTMGTEYEFLGEPPGLNYFAALATVLVGNIGTYLFILLSCWFSTEKIGFRTDRILRLLWQVWTTCLLCAGFGAAFRLRSFTMRTLLREMVTPFGPQNGTQYWYVTAFAAFLLLLPALQYLAQKLDDKKIGFLCVVLIALGPLRQFIDTDLLGDVGDFVLMFFLCVYMKHKPDNWLRRHCFLGLALLALLVAGTLLARVVLPERLAGFTIVGTSGGRFNVMILRLRKRTIFQMFGALCLFYAFDRLRIRPVAAINRLAGYAFGVYLWHYNVMFREVIWQDVFHSEQLFRGGSPVYVLIPLLAPLAVYLAASAVEFVRRRVLDQWLYPKLPWNASLCAKLDSIYDWSKQQV